MFWQDVEDADMAEFPEAVKEAVSEGKVDNVNNIAIAVIVIVIILAFISIVD